MSKVGKKPVLIPSGVEVADTGTLFVVKGPKGELTRKYPSRLLSLKIDKNSASIFPKSKSESAYINWGTYRSHLNNMVKGVCEGWKKSLELVGVGYRAELEGRNLLLTVGYSHPVRIVCPEGITFSVEKTVINIEGIDKELVGLIADKIRSVRPPEPYKGKGIKYVDEIIRRKAGKAAKTQGV